MISKEEGTRRDTEQQIELWAGGTGFWVPNQTSNIVFLKEANQRVGSTCSTRVMLGRVAAAVSLAHDLSTQLEYFSVKQKCERNKQGMETCV